MSTSTTTFLIEPSETLDMLRKYNIGSLIQEAHEPLEALIYAHTTHPISMAMHLFRIHNIISLPIFDKDQSKFVAILNVVDVNRFLMLKDVTKKLNENSANDPALKKEISQMYLTPITDVLFQVATSRPFRVYHASEPLLDALRAMATGHERTYAILASLTKNKADADSDIQHASIITQWDVVSALLKSETIKVPLKLDIPAKQIMMRASITFTKHDDPNQPSRRLPITPGKSSFALHVYKDVSTIAAFKTMAIHDLSSVAIIERHPDNDPSIVDNLSASDIRYLDEVNLYTDSLLPTTEFLKKIHGHPPHPIAFSGEAHLREIMQAAVENGVHRVWIVEGEAKKPIGVVSMSDMLGMIVCAS